MTRLLDKSLARRAEMNLSATDAFRLVDGEGDRLPGIYLDEFAGHRLLSTLGSAPPTKLREWAAATGITTYCKQLARHEKEAPTHLAGPEQREPFPILEQGVRFRVSFQSGYSQGIFLDQRDNRRRVRERCQTGDLVLNTFAYTGAFSVCAALAGAVTTTLDLSQPYLDWARDNFQLNGIDPTSQHFCKGDTFHWLRRFARQGRLFQGIILDPPTFSRDDQGRVFRAENDYGELVALAAACLAPGGWLLCTTNCHRISESEFTTTVRNALPHPADLQSHPMPPDFTGEQYLKTLMVAV